MRLLHSLVIMLAIASVFAPMAAAGELENRLMDAAYRGQTDVVRELIAKGADANAREDMGGITVLMMAANEGRADCVRLLLANGADINARDFNGGTALMTAARTGMSERRANLHDEGADSQPPMAFASVASASAIGHADCNKRPRRKQRGITLPL